MDWWKQFEIEYYPPNTDALKEVSPGRFVSDGKRLTGKVKIAAPHRPRGKKYLDISISQSQWEDIYQLVSLIEDLQDALEAHE